MILFVCLFFSFLSLNYNQLWSLSSTLLHLSLSLDSRFLLLSGYHWLQWSLVSTLLLKLVLLSCGAGLLQYWEDVLEFSFHLPTWNLFSLNAGVSMASLTELSFNWTGFISAMISNISFTYRSIYSKKAMVMFHATLNILQRFQPLELIIIIIIFWAMILFCRQIWTVLISMPTYLLLPSLSAFHLP